MKKVLFLAPFAVVKEFHYPLVSLAKTPQDRGYQVTMVHCQQAMAGDCTAMLAKGLGLEADENKKQLFCAECHRGAFYAAKFYPWETLWLYPQCPTPLLRPKILSSHELRQIAGYEIVLSQKLLNRKPAPQVQIAWRLRYRQLQEIMPQAWQILLNKNPDLIISYNSLYGIHRLFCRLGDQLKIPSLCLHQSFNMDEEEEYVPFKNNVTEFLTHLQKKAGHNKSALSQIEKSKIKKHIAGLFSAKKPWAYSAPISSVNTESASRLQGAKQKVLVALSSPDELLGLELLSLLPKNIKQPFRDQISWLLWIFSLAPKFPHVQFFIRPHPRLYSNKRETKKSEFSSHLEKIEKKWRPANVVWLKQENQGSIWDHLKDTDILFNAWSSVGDIFAYHNIPVLQFFPRFTNSGKAFGISGPSKKYYEEKIRQILAGKSVKKTRRDAQNWLSAYLCTNTFKLVWKAKAWLLVVRKILPRRFREIWDLASFSLFDIQSEWEKIETVIKSATVITKNRQIPKFKEK